MEVHYATPKLQRMCDTDKERRKHLGPDRAKQAAVRLADMQAAETLSDLRHMPGKYHELTGDLAGHLAVSIGANRRLLLKPTTWVDKAEGGLDWSAVKSVTIVDCTDYH